MADVLKGLTGAATVFLFAWIFPCAVVLGAMYFFLVPWLVWVPESLQPAHADFAKATLLIAFAAVALGLLLSGIETPLYRILEWYAFPRWLHRYGVCRQRIRRDNLLKRLAKVREEAERERKAGRPYPDWEETLVQEKLARFPTNDAQLAASRLANALRSFETYGADRFSLDSTTLWTELLVVVPDAMRKELDQARAAVDFLVCLVYLTVAFALASLSGLIGRGALSWKLFVDNWGFLAVAAGAFVLARLWYRGAAVVCTYWASTVRALVNLGRLELAKQLGLRVPATIDEERRMWRAVSNFVLGLDQTLPPSDRLQQAELDQTLNAFRSDQTTSAARST